MSVAENVRLVGTAKNIKKILKPADFAPIYDVEKKWAELSSVLPSGENFKLPQQ